MEIKIFGDYHTHSTYSDAVSSMTDVFQRAKDIGLVELGISDHGYNNPLGGSLRPRTAKKQAKQIEELRERYAPLNIRHAIEADIIGLNGEIDITHEQMEMFDYVVCGWHLFARNKNIKSFFRMNMPSYLSGIKAPSQETIARNTRAYIKMITDNPIGILAHVNHGCKVNVREVAKCCADYGTYVELNNKNGIHGEDLEEILATEAKLIVSSDAHEAKSIARLDKIEKILDRYPEAYSRIINVHEKHVEFRKIK